MKVAPAQVVDSIDCPDSRDRDHGGQGAFVAPDTVKRDKPKKGANMPGIYDEASCTPAKETFKVYALEDEGKKTQLKEYMVNVTGFVVNGADSGVAICKKPALKWNETIGPGRHDL